MRFNALKMNIVRQLLVISISAVAVFLATGCGSSKESQVQNIPEARPKLQTQVFPEWVKSARKKAKKQEKYLTLKAPKSVSEKRVMVAHPDSTRRDSALVFIGDVAELAYLSKINKIYISDAGHDAASFYTNGIVEADSLKTVSQSVIEISIAELKKTALNSAHRYDSLVQVSIALFDKLNKQMAVLLFKQNPRTVDEEIQLIGAMEKMKVVAFSIQSMSRATVLEYHAAIGFFKESPRLSALKKSSLRECYATIERVQVYGREKQRYFDELNGKLTQTAENPLEKAAPAPEVIQTCREIAKAFKNTCKNLDSCKAKLKR